MITTPLPLIYIAGPFRGPTPLDVRRNVEAARDLGLRVAQAGGYPVIPHTMTAEFDKQLTDEFWLQGTLEMLKRCDAIMLGIHWRRSAGAQGERNYAAENNITIFFEHNGLDDLTSWIYSWQHSRQVVA